MDRVEQNKTIRRPNHAKGQRHKLAPKSLLFKDNLSNEQLPQATGAESFDPFPLQIHPPPLFDPFSPVPTTDANFCRSSACAIRRGQSTFGEVSTNHDAIVRRRGHKKGRSISGLIRCASQPAFPYFFHTEGGRTA